MTTIQKKLDEAAQFINQQINLKPSVGVVLGSGLGIFVDQIKNKKIISYNDIPHFNKTTVEGHAGNLVLGDLDGTPIVALQGRFHPYEGLSMDEVVFPIRLLKKLGVQILFVTNAAGGVNLNYKPGDLIIIEDQINLMGKNPLIGPNDSNLGVRFPDMSRAYDLELISTIEKVSARLLPENKKCHKGVYAGVLGPTYETPAEIKMIRTLGGDMVGMSTVPEVIAARHMGLKVCGISCITNMGAGILNQTLKHEDIKDEALKVKHLFNSIVSESIKEFMKGK